MALATATPLAFSMVGDLFPAEDRPNACALVAAALGGGQLGGQLFAGIVTPNEKWRNSFFCCGLLTCAAAALAYSRMLEPKRGAKEAPAAAFDAAKPLGTPKKRRRRALCVPTNLLLFIQALPNSIPWGVLSVYLIDFLSQERGYTVQSATMLTGLFGAGAAVGGIAGAVIGGLLYSRQKKVLPTFMGVATALATVAMRMLVQTRNDPTTAAALAALGGGLASVNGANIRTLILNVTEPSKAA
jgi:MFS family permease